MCEESSNAVLMELKGLELIGSTWRFGCFKTLIFARLLPQTENNRNSFDLFGEFYFAAG